MKIKVITVGKIKEKYFVNAIGEYVKRLGAYCKVEEVEVGDEKCPENLSDKEMIQVKDKEGERILSKIKDGDYVIALAIEGKQISSEDLADHINSLAVSGKSDVAFVIGGSLGLSDEVMKRANYKLSFSKMTFPHQLMKVVLVEQVYRAFRIINGHAYHK
ncbi:MAG: 23S rRNA (pseudouridine(1915)-N(3))-methyltransferase RlmH [Clostridia bacterium]|nr:23S rRNA (pseudouridine(1915)-N(3))-methyltransferase RlmH [Clostridia bacterium]